MSGDKGIFLERLRSPIAEEPSVRMPGIIPSGALIDCDLLFLGDATQARWRSTGKVSTEIDTSLNTKLEGFGFAGNNQIMTCTNPIITGSGPWTSFVVLKSSVHNGAYQLFGIVGQHNVPDYYMARRFDGVWGFGHWGGPDISTTLPATNGLVVLAMTKTTLLHSFLVNGVVAYQNPDASSIIGTSFLPFCSFVSNAEMMCCGFTRRIMTGEELKRIYNYFSAFA